MTSIFRVFTSRPLLGHWRSKLAVAAAVLVAVTIGVYALQHGSQQTAYALDDLPRRLLEIKSIYLTGWMFQPHWTSDQGIPTKYPLRIFAERPDCFWHTSYGFSGPDATHKDIRVQSGYGAGRGTKRLSVSYNDKTAMETTLDALKNELSTEMFIQMELPQQLLSGRPHDFVKTGAETVNNVLCDVYEHSFDKATSKRRVWLDPKTGLPVKIASYDVDKAGHETLTHLFDHVEVNISASATGLSFDPPAGYRTAKAPPSTAESPFWPVSHGDSGDVSLGVWHSFNVDDKAILVALFCESRSRGRNAATVQPEFTLGEARPCQHKEIASADVDGHRWSWSLVWPKQAAEPVGNDQLFVSYRSKRGGVISMVIHPIRLREDRLKAILDEVQRLTKTSVPGSQKPFSLDTLRVQITSR